MRLGTLKKQLLTYFCLKILGLAFLGCSVNLNLPSPPRPPVGDTLSIRAVTITNTINIGYVDTNVFSLNYFGVSGDYTEYCILENDVDISNCTSWLPGQLPSTFTVGSTNELKTLSVWIRNNTLVSQRVDSNAVILDTVFPTVALTSLTGGSTVTGGGTTSVTWTPASDLNLSGSPIRIDVSSDGGASWSALASDLPNSGGYSWSIPSVDSSTYRVRVTVTDLAGNTTSDSSSLNFSISTPSANLAFGITSYDFGKRVIGGSPKATLTIVNNGNLAATGLSFLNFNSIFQNTLEGDCGATLAVSAACTLIVSFTPVTTTNYLQTISLSYSDSTNASRSTSLQLTGEGEIGSPFVFMWRTQTVNDSLSLPLRNGYQYNFVVNWGDGQTSTVTSASDSDITHTYAGGAGDDHVVTITGYAEAWSFGSHPDASSLLEVIDLGNLGWIDLSEAFAECTNLSDFAGGDTKHVVNMSGMFRGSTQIYQPNLSSFDTSKVNDMSSMFAGATQIAILNLSNFNTINVNSMAYMFLGTTNLQNLDISNFNTTNVQDMSFMFSNMILSNLDVSHFNTENVAEMKGMFQSFVGQTSIDLSSFNTSNVQNMNSMFAQSGFSTLDLSSFNTSEVTTMIGMFSNTPNLTSINLSSFNTSNVTSMDDMFRDAVSLTSLDMSSFDTSQVTSMVSMFSGTASLTGLNALGWDVSSVLFSSGIYLNSNVGLVVRCDQGGAPGIGALFGKSCAP